MVQEARAGTSPGSTPANSGSDVPGGRTRGGKQQPLSAIGASMITPLRIAYCLLMDYFLED